MKKVFFISVAFIALLSACNKKSQFADYKYTTVYFPYQSPERTLELGEDLTVDNTQDNLHKFSIFATMGGVYENNKNITITAVLDTSLVQNLKFNSTSGDNIVALPANYYTLPSNSFNIIIPSGSIQGGVDIQLTDAFFADPRSIKNTFVVPLKIKSVTNADSILRGISTLASPDPRRSADWTTVPKDYVLYGIKYINPYHGAYLRRGIDIVTGNGGNTALDTTVIYHKTYVEQDEVTYLFTKSLAQDSMSLNLKNKGNLNSPFMYVVNFDNTGKCTLSAPTGATYTVSGTGEFVKKGDAWGNQPRDVLHLNYIVNFGTITHNVTDTLVMRDRQVKFETFTPTFY